MDYCLLPNGTGSIFIIGMGTYPNNIIGEQLVHPAAPIFLQLAVNSNLHTDCKVTFNTKILENSPEAPLYTAFIFSKNTYCIQLYFEFDCLDCFFYQFLLPQLKSRSIFAPPTKKSFPHLSVWSLCCRKKIVQIIVCGLMHNKHV